MKRYKCIKEVDAMQIVKMTGEYGPDKDTILHGPDGEEIRVNKAWILRHEPKIHGYYVIYKDGYTSYSPKRAFEEGYIELTDDTDTVAYYPV